MGCRRAGRGFPLAGWQRPKPGWCTDWAARRFPVNCPHSVKGNHNPCRQWPRAIKSPCKPGKRWAPIQAELIRPELSTFDREAYSEEGGKARKDMTEGTRVELLRSVDPQRRA